MRREHLFIVLTSVLMTLLLLAPVGYVVHRHLRLRLATVDLQQLIEENRQHTLKKISQNRTTTDEARAMTAQQTADFAKKLSRTLNALGQTCHCVIVNPAALLAGTTLDYTDWVREELKP